MASNAEDPLNTVYDSGLALERTMLAWQRTIMALIVIGVALARYWYESSHKLLPAVLGISAFCVVIGLMSWVRWRYRKTHRNLKEQGSLGARDGKPVLVLVLFVLVSSISSVLFALLS